MKKAWLAVPLLSLAAACGSLDAYNDKLGLDDCPELCSEALVAVQSMEDQGCMTLCDVGIAPDWYGQADVVLFNLVNIWGEVDKDGGGTCDLVLFCGEEGACLAMFEGAMDDTAGNTDTATQAFLDCLQQQDPLCDEQLGDCTDDHDQVYDDCMADWNDVEYCSCVAQEHDNVCYCQYDACQSGGDALDCHAADCEQPPPPIPLPVQTEPGRFTISRRFLDAQMARADAIQAQTGVWPARNHMTTAWKGVRVQDIQPGEVLYRIGLRSKDILLHANNISVLSAFTQPAALLQLRTASEIRLLIERNGEQKQLVYTMVP